MKVESSNTIKDDTLLKEKKKDGRPTKIPVFSIPLDITYMHLGPRPLLPFLSLLWSQEFNFFFLKNNIF